MFGKVKKINSKDGLINNIEICKFILVETNFLSN